MKRAITPNNVDLVKNNVQRIHYGAAYCQRQNRYTQRDSGLRVLELFYETA